jgi:hypothetical protein
MRLSIAREIVEAEYHHFVDKMDGKFPTDKIIVPYLKSKPGLGKTAMWYQLAAHLKISCAVMPAAQYDAGELAGWKVPSKDLTKMLSVRPEWLPSEGKGILLCDELPQAPQSNQCIMGQLFYERQIGGHKLGDGWFVGAAGNGAGDKAGSMPIPSHVKGRLQTLEVEANLDDTVAYYNRIGLDSRVPAYLKFRPDFLHQFDANADACPSPRGWHFVASQLKLNLSPTARIESAAGLVGRAPAGDFLGYLKLIEVCPDIDGLIADPEDAIISSDAGITHAICAALAQRMNHENADNIMTYVNRLPRQDLAAYVVKDAISRVVKLAQHPAVRQWALDHKEMIL